jgi:isocitrate/isopropylmalate dehydrogenase
MKKVCVIAGDGIGQEVVPQAVRTLEALNAPLRFTEAEMGLACHASTGSYLPETTLDCIRDSEATLFGAITSPPAGTPNYSSPILALRKQFDLYANVRPVRRLRPDIGLVDLDCLIVRENTEGMYTGTRKALDLCAMQGRKRITCVHKANVMRRSDGLFRRVFMEEAQGSGLDVDEMLVDAAAAALVTTPRRLDCIVTLNLYGDILSDEAAALIGGLGLAPSVNLGDRYAVFEPTHGSAPDIAGRGIANPIATMLSAAMMLRHLELPDSALRLEAAIGRTLEDGVRTPDLGGKATTASFTDAVIARL